MGQVKIENAEVREGVERAKREHVHQWGLITDGPDCDECEYAATLGLAYCKCGETIGPSVIERKLNATERLSAEQAMTFSFIIRQLARLVGEITEKASGDTRLLEFVNGGITEDQLQNYAAALESENESS